MYKYLKYIWHDPNCPAWDRNAKTNKEYPHLLRRFGKKRTCICGYDKDYERLQKFIKGEK